MFSLLKRLFSGAPPRDVVLAEAALANVESEDTRHLETSAVTNTGNALMADGLFEQAIGCYRQAIAIRPEHVEAYVNLAYALMQLKRNREAEASLLKAIEIDGGNADAFYMLGTLARDDGEVEEAMDAFESAIALRTDFLEAHGALAHMLIRLDRRLDALACYHRALTSMPGEIDLLLQQGKVFFSLKRFDEALENFNHVLQKHPDHVAALMGRGAIFHALRRNVEALDDCDRVTRLMPHAAEAHLNHSSALQKLNLHEHALASCKNALRIRPDWTDALVNQAASLCALNRPAQGLASYVRAIEMTPDDVDAHYGESLCRLMLGDFKRGWELYEWRWRNDQFIASKRQFSQPLWLGIEDLASKTILLHDEQGFGDTIQFCRYVKVVAAQGAIVFLLVPESLRTLLADLAGVSMLISGEDALPPFDFHCPLMSLPLACSRRSDISSATASYIHASLAHATKWQARLGPKDKPRIGLAWSGSAVHLNDGNRSVPLAAICALFSTRAEFIGVQKEVRGSDLDTLAQYESLTHFGNEIENFADTAGLIANLDLVISVDTSVAHLAGAMGKPVWLLLPFSADWRWLTDRDDTPWYPSARLFRQTSAGDWSELFSRVKARLDSVLNEESTPLWPVGIVSTLPSTADRRGPLAYHGRQD